MAVDSDCPILQWIAALPDHFWQTWQTSCAASQVVSAAVSADGVAAAAVDSTWNHAAEKAKADVGQSAAAVFQHGSMSPTSDLCGAGAVADAGGGGVKERFFGSLGGAGQAALGDIA